MGLMLATARDLVIGKPLRWQLYDSEQNPLLDEGEIVRDEAHRNELLAGGACYEFEELPEEEPESESAPVAPSAASPAVEPLMPMPDLSGMNADSPFAEAKVLEAKAAEDPASKTYTFDDMKLKVEDRLQLEPPAKLGSERLTVRVLGYLRGGTIMVTTPFTSTGQRLQLLENEIVVMRSFSGQNAFAFESSVVRICRLPYEYLHLSFPTKIEGMVIRKAPRVKSRIIAAVHHSKSTKDKQISVLISDISAKGASLDSKVQLGEKGEILHLAFRVQLHNIEAFLSIKGIIRAVIKGEAEATAKDGATTPLIRHGVEFQDLQANDNVILQSMIYQQMIENPDKLI